MGHARRRLTGPNFAGSPHCRLIAPLIPLDAAQICLFPLLGQCMAPPFSPQSPPPISARRPACPAPRRPVNAPSRAPRPLVARPFGDCNTAVVELHLLLFAIVALHRPVPTHGRHGCSILGVIHIWLVGGGGFHHRYSSKKKKPATKKPNVAGPDKKQTRLQQNTSPVPVKIMSSSPGRNETSRRSNKKNLSIVAKKKPVPAKTSELVVRF